MVRFQTHTNDNEFVHRRLKKMLQKNAEKVCTIRYIHGCLNRFSLDSSNKWL